MVLWFIDHVAVGPVDHAVADHRWQLLIASVPGHHQPPCWVEFTTQNTQYSVTSLYNGDKNKQLLQIIIADFFLPDLVLCIQH